MPTLNSMKTWNSLAEHQQTGPRTALCCQVSGGRQPGHRQSSGHPIYQPLLWSVRLLVKGPGVLSQQEHYGDVRHHHSITCIEALQHKRSRQCNTVSACDCHSLTSI